jgi:2-polyprenyl-6-methoxyphenol hydroxylase-like FAD-dependent oxidoreductase
MPPGEFCTRVAQAGAGTLGKLELITPPAAFALTHLEVRDIVKPRLALIGDAAHVVHPLAGQGVNLGFGDARALAAVLQDRAASRDPGDYSLLRRFARSRAEDILAMRLVTDGLQRLFRARQPWVARLRNLGLNLTDAVPVIKTMLARRAMS